MGLRDSCRRAPSAIAIEAEQKIEIRAIIGWIDAIADR
jgi:hypothetical protein